MKPSACGRIGSLRRLCAGAVYAIAVVAAAAQDSGEAHPQHLQGEANRHMHQHDFNELVERFESPDRAEWQKPDRVIEQLGDLGGKTVADIGTGTGYFAFPLAAKAKKVLAIDIDERMLDYIRERKEGSGAGANIETRLATPDDPRLSPGEADAILIVNTYHHIENRVDYLRTLQQGMSDESRLVIVEFHKKELPVGPPPEMKLEPERVRDELRAAEFEQIEIDTDLLPYQYIVTTMRK